MVKLPLFQDTNPLLSVVGRCCILEMEDYTKSRPTQYGEEDVYVCENVYDESRRVIRSLPATGLKRYEYGKEFWHFFHKKWRFYIQHSGNTGTCVF